MRFFIHLGFCWVPTGFCLGTVCLPRLFLPFQCRILCQGSVCFGFAAFFFGFAWFLYWFCFGSAWYLSVICLGSALYLFMICLGSAWDTSDLLGFCLVSVCDLLGFCLGSMVLWLTYLLLRCFCTGYEKIEVKRPNSLT
jgi:hypothetical protein